MEGLAMPLIYAYNNRNTNRLNVVTLIKESIKILVMENRNAGRIVGVLT
jgi:hypothetical protein